MIIEEKVMEQTIELSGKEKFLSIFENLDYHFDADFSKEVREKAKEDIKALEFPNAKSEYWKYSRTNKIARGNFKVKAIGHFETKFNLPKGKRLVLVNGFVNDSLSDYSKSDAMIVSLSEAKLEHADSIRKYFGQNTFKDEIFASINTAYHQDGAFIFFPKNHCETSPLHIVSIITENDAIAQPRNLIVASKGSKGSVVLREISENANSCFSNMLNEVFVEENASLEIDKIQDAVGDNFQICTDQVNLYSDSRFTINSFTKSGEWVRNNLNILLKGPNIESWLNGLYLLKGNQHVDNHTYIDHLYPNCTSHELYKGILDDSSTGVFNGKVYVHKFAQKTNAYQSNATVLLTDDAKSFSKPELEIYADDVKCSHGSTTGQLDEEAIFYLQSRGITEEKARGMMLHAFALDVIEQIADEEIAKEIKDFVMEQYAG